MVILRVIFVTKILLVWGFHEVSAGSKRLKDSGAIPPWESMRCVKFWGDPPFINAPMQTRELFSSSKEIDFNSDPEVARKLNANISWPPTQERGSVDDFFDALKGRKAKATGVKTRRPTVVAAKVDHLRRSIYIKNLKAGSSTVDVMYSALAAFDVFDHQNAPLLNISEQLLFCMNSPRLKPCVMHWVKLHEIPDELIANYFIFSFVRDPFPRVSSAFQEVNTGAFTVTMKGRTRNSQNAHFSGQIHELSRGTLSGNQVRMDFVGHLENISEDWERLKPALSIAAKGMSPLERRDLVLTSTKSFSLVEKYRKSVVSAIFVPSSTTEMYSNSHVVLVCRRYIQDFVCFNISIPLICIDHVELVLDL
jgi:hypothetical protein